MPAHQRLVPAALVFLFTQACMTAARPSRAALDAQGGTTESLYAGTGKSTLSTADLAKTSATNLLDALRQLRPEYLRTTSRAVSRITMNELSVYENDRYAGTTSTLSLIPLTVVLDLRRIEAVEAKSLFGSSCPCDGGVILVRTARR
jgi:hypothetical protein